MALPQPSMKENRLNFTTDINRRLYLDLLERVLTATLTTQEPSLSYENPLAYAANFHRHYIQGPAISMLPLIRFKNLRSCMQEVIQNNVPGDFIETGVWRGGATIFMRAVLKSYAIDDRLVWVADSFEGLPFPDPEKYPKEAAARQGKVMTKLFENLQAGLQEVQRNFATFGLLDEQVRFLKGWFKDTLPQAPIEQLALMRLDGDFYESTMDALVNLYDKLSVGGIVIVDDYGEDTWTECRKAVDDFRRSRSIHDPLTAVDSSCSWWRKSS